MFVFNDNADFDKFVKDFDLKTRDRGIGNGTDSENIFLKRRDDPTVITYYVVIYKLLEDVKALKETVKTQENLLNTYEERFNMIWDNTSARVNQHEKLMMQKIKELDKMMEKMKNE